MKLTDRELAHVLACIRWCQHIDVDLSEMEHFEEIEDGPLSDTAADALCEKFNLDCHILTDEQVTGDCHPNDRELFLRRADDKHCSEEIEIGGAIWLSDDGDGPQGAWVEARVYVDGEGILYPEGGEPGDEME